MTKAAEGKCKKCGEGVPAEGRVTCEECLQKFRDWHYRIRERKRKEGRCWVCGKSTDTGTRCKDCHAKNMAQITERRRRWMAEGRCRDCGREAVTTKRSMRGKDRSEYCRDCYLKVMARGILGSARHWTVLLAKLDECGWRCPYTGETLVLGDNLSFDHILPVCRFPEKRHDSENVEPISWQVNLMKRDLTRDEFLTFIRRVHDNCCGQRE